MKFIVTILCLFIAIANCLPAITPVQGTTFDLESQIEDFAETNLDDKALQLYHEVVNSFKDYSKSQSKNLVRRDDALELQIEAILTMVNSSGIIWQVLDAIANDSSRIQTLSNITTSLLGGRNITINLASLLLASSSLSKSVNLTGIITAVEQSGLVTSILDGILLDTNFRPRLVDLIYRFVISKQDILLYLFAVISKRDGMLLEGDLYEVLTKRADEYNGTLVTFLNDAIGTILSSPLVANVAADFLDALNDTGFAVYTIQRFLSSDTYLNMSAYLIDNILSSSGITIDTSGFNITRLIGAALSNPTAIASVVGSLLDGDTSQFLGYLGKYASAVGSIIHDLEAKGLFAELNSYIFGDTGSTTSAASTSGSGSSNNKDVVTTTTSGSSISASTTRQSSSATNGAAAVAVSNLFIGSDSNSSLLKALFAIVGGALLML